MRSFLVDFENVKSKGLVGIDQVGSDDHVVIFYSENSDTISFEMHCSVMRAAASVEYMKVNVGGKNALDFQALYPAGIHGGAAEQLAHFHYQQR